jgi:hypothetical protein
MHHTQHLQHVNIVSFSCIYSENSRDIFKEELHLKQSMNLSEGHRETKLEKYEVWQLNNQICTFVQQLTTLMSWYVLDHITT